MTKRLYKQEVRTINKKKVVLIERQHARTHYPEPDFEGTGMALQGILKEGETLEQFNRRLFIRQKKREKEFA